MNDSSASSDPSPTSADEPYDLSLPRVAAVLPPIPGGEENLLPVSALGAPVRVEFDLWDSSNPAVQSERLELFWDDRVVANKSWNAPIPANDLFILLPVQDLLQDGPHQLRYQVRDWANNLLVSPSLTITIDIRAPAHPGIPARLGFDYEVENIGITNRYLENNDNKVKATVPSVTYEFKPGDRLTAYWEELPTGTREILSVELTPDLSVVFDGEQIIREGNGRRFVTYRLQDRAGNVSNLSEFTAVNVDIRPAEPRTVPTVVGARPGDNEAAGILDPKNTTSGVTARVPAQPDDISDATLTLHWRGFGDLGSFQTSTPTVPGGLDFRIPASAIPSNMGRVVEVFYSVQWPTGDPEISAIYRLTVERLGTTTMMPLSCAQSVSGNLSLANVPQAGANLSMAAWPYKPVADGMRVNLWVTGVNNQGQAVRFDLLEAQPVPKNTAPVTTVAPRAELLKLQVNKVFAVRAAVSFDDGETYLAFKQLDLTLTA